MTLRTAMSLGSRQDNSAETLFQDLSNPFNSTTVSLEQSLIEVYHDAEHC